MNRLILDINKQVELTAFYTKENDILYIRNVYVYENGIETKYKSKIKGNTIDELKEKLLNEFSNNNADCCYICGKEVS